MIFKKDNRSIEYKIVNKNNKNAYFRVQNQKVIITSGPHISNDKILKVLDDNFNKFYELIENQKSLASLEYLILFGKDYFINLVDAKAKAYYFSENDVHIKIENRNDLDKYIDEIYRIELSKKICELTELIKPNLKAHSLYIVPTYIKKYKSRFGVCDVVKKEITINLFLAKIDPVFLLYVLYHEYAHLQVPNHSKKFYDLLSQLLPNYKIIRKQLKKIAIY